MGSLATYQRKRVFSKTPEPAGKKERSKTGRMFVVQKHRASHLHYDFRLEIDGVLASWAVPRGPSLDPSVKRLARAVEDHPISYGDFEGTIPEGEYGGGTVMVWDAGTYEPEGVFDLAKGELKFTMRGKKLKGSWVLVRTYAGGGRNWLLMKHKDRYASTADITEEKPRSVLSRKLLARIAADHGGDVEKAATGDPGGSAHEHARTGEPVKASTARRASSKQPKLLPKKRP